MNSKGNVEWIKFSKIKKYALHVCTINIGCMICGEVVLSGRVGAHSLTQNYTGYKLYLKMGSSVAAVCKHPISTGLALQPRSGASIARRAAPVCVNASSVDIERAFASNTR